MAPFHAVADLALVLEDDDLIVPVLGPDVGQHSGVGHQWVAQDQPIVLEIASTFPSSMEEPSSTGSFSTSMTSPGLTRYCLPPVFKIA